MFGWRNRRSDGVDLSRKEIPGEKTESREGVGRGRVGDKCIRGSEFQGGDD